MTPRHGTVYGPDRPSRAAAEAAAARVIRRRRRLRDTHLEQLRDDLLSVVEHAHRHTDLDPPMPPGATPAQVRQVVRAALLDDFADAWLITRYLRHAVDAAQLGLIGMARDDAGQPYSSIAPVLGVTSRQGVSETRFRLGAAVEGLPKDRAAARRERRAARHHAEDLDRRALTIEAFARELLQHRTALAETIRDSPAASVEDLDGIRYDLDNLADQVAAVAAGRPVPTSMPVVVRLLMESLDEAAPDWPTLDPGLAAAVDHARTLLRQGSTR